MGSWLDKHIGKLGLVLITGSLALAVTADNVVAQDHPGTGTTTVNAGLWRYTLDGSGTTGFFALRSDMVFSEMSLLEFSLGYTTPNQRFGRTNLWIAEVSFQAQRPMGRIAPFAGIGAGVALDRPPEGVERDGKLDAIFSLSTGVRAQLDRRTRLRTDIRFRGIDPSFDRRALEWTVGIGWIW